ncbi:MAG: hypothetical protein FPO08_07610 [Geobacter sp.]|nr:MAG: hypothetical protein FPO08_07610 [Geobacter sp.]
MRKNKESKDHLVDSAKKEASRLHQILLPQIPALTYCQCLEMVAKIKGRKNWNTYYSATERSRNPLPLESLNDIMIGTILPQLKAEIP